MEPTSELDRTLPKRLASNHDQTGFRNSMSETPSPIIQHAGPASDDIDDSLSAAGKKRKRLNNWDATGSEPASTLASTTVSSGAQTPVRMAVDGEVIVAPTEFSAVKRDDAYYFDDGSCIFLVQNTLFNVHRSIMSKDHSSFSTMFALPQGGRESEGKSDSNPIVLLGDTPSEFRHFLWALYALPPEIGLINSPGSDLTQLIDIARISNKYSFKSVETWSLDAIQEYVNRKPSPILTAIPSASSYSFSHDISTSASDTARNGNIESTAQLIRLIRLAQMCNHERLLNAMISILRGLMSSSLQYAYLAMTLADELDLRALRGAAYLEVMQKATIVKKGRFEIPKRPPPKPATPVAGAVVVAAPASGSAGTVTAPGTPSTSSSSEGTPEAEEDVVIKPSQQLRLLTGYYRLSHTWEDLRKTPPHFDHSPSCGATWHQHGCTQSWLEFWKEKTRSDNLLSLGIADVLGRLKQVQKDYDRWGSATYMHHDCKMAARRSIMDTIKTVEDALPDYFSESGVDE